MTAPVPDLSILVCAYNMQRELVRTLETLTPRYQRGTGSLRWEVIVLDNGSDCPVEKNLGQLFPHVKVVYPEQVHGSPAKAINAAMALARVPLLGLLIDGARMASPGIIRLAHEAWRIDPNKAVGTLAFHLGPDVQQRSVPEGYDAEQEDRLLGSVHWREDGYRLFDISVLALSSAAGWSGPIAESNAVFLDRRVWHALGGLEERFQFPGGGYVNLDFWERAVAYSQHKPWILLGEGTFHQVHGGVSTNGPEGVRNQMADDYHRIHGRPYLLPQYLPRFIGEPRRRVGL